MTHPQSPQGRLIWRCRRGMKELDLMLMRYVRENWDGALPEERAAFDWFLELPDPVLAGYLMDREIPVDLAQQKLLAILRSGSRQRLP